MKQVVLGRNIELTVDVLEDENALELIAAWFTQDKVKIFTRIGTQLDQNPEYWVEIIHAIVNNILIQHEKDRDRIKEQLIQKLSSD